MHVEKPQSTDETHKEEHSSKIYRFLELGILDGLKKSIHRHKNVLSKELDDEYLEKCSRERNAKIILCEPSCSEEENE